MGKALKEVSVALAFPLNLLADKGLEKLTEKLVPGKLLLSEASPSCCSDIFMQMEGLQSQCGDSSSESPGTRSHTQLESGARLTAISP